MFQGEYCGRRFHNGNRYVELCVGIELFVSELNHGPLLDYAAAHISSLSPLHIICKNKLCY